MPGDVLNYTHQNPGLCWSWGELFASKKREVVPQCDEFWLKGNDEAGGPTSTASKLGQENDQFR
jgi:hypothetical protein